MIRSSISHPKNSFLEKRKCDCMKNITTYEVIIKEKKMRKPKSYHSDVGVKES